MIKQGETAEVDKISALSLIRRGVAVEAEATKEVKIEADTKRKKAK